MSVGQTFIRMRSVTEALAGAEKGYTSMSVFSSAPVQPPEVDQVGAHQPGVVGQGAMVPGQPVGAAVDADHRALGVPLGQLTRRQADATAGIQNQRPIAALGSPGVGRGEGRAGVRGQRLAQRMGQGPGDAARQVLVGGGLAGGNDARAFWHDGNRWTTTKSAILAAGNRPAQARGAMPRHDAVAGRVL